MFPDPFQPNLTAAIAESAAEYDSHGGWPRKAIDALTSAGAWRWSIAAEFGGDPLHPVDQLRAYEAIARGSVAVALIVTQRDGACDLIAGGENDALKTRLLPAFARGERFTSVGIAQLTTSKGKDGKPHMTATPDGDGFVLNGRMPWVTGGPACDEIVTGGVLEDGLQVLGVVSTDDPGVTLGDPAKLLALDASCTGRVECEGVRIGPEQLIRGPAEAALKMSTPVKPLVVSSVGLGLAGAIDDALAAMEDRLSAPLVDPVARVRRLYREVRTAVFAAGEKAVEDPGEEIPKAALRVRVNDLLTRQAITLMTASKGAGFTQSHPTQRLVRESMFFHVWSASPAVQGETLGRLFGGT